MRQLRAALAVPLVFVALLAPPAAAQNGGVKALLNSSSPSHEVQADEVVPLAVESFRVTARRRLGLGEQEEGALDDAAHVSEKYRAELAERSVERFRSRAEVEVAELQGDGLLFADEVSKALQSLREDQLDALEEDLSAQRAGHTPPPRRDAFEDEWSYNLAALRYIGVERNSWIDWTVLIGAALAGLVLAIGVLKVSNWKTDKEKRRERWKALIQPVIDSLHGPLYLLLTTGGLALGLFAVWLPPAVKEPVRIVLLLLVVLGVFWMTWRLSSSLPHRIGAWVTPGESQPGRQVLEVIRKMIRLGILLLFAFLAVEVIFGADLTALLAGVGIVGLAVTLAAQDTLKDLFAALTIHVNSPFSLGSLVRYAGFFGTVEEIGFRMTRIRTLDGHLVTVPNAKLVSEPVENVGARTHVRRRFRLDLPYDTDLENVSKAVNAVRETIRSCGNLDPDQDVQVHFDEFGPHSLKLLVQYYYESGDYWASKEKATEVDLAIMECFRENGLDFAFPTQTLHVHQEGDAQPDNQDAGDED